MVASYPWVGELTGESGWNEDLEAEELADVLRSAMREEYADASDEDMGDALENVLDSMSPAEALSSGSALSQIGKSASRLAGEEINQAFGNSPLGGGNEPAWFTFTVAIWLWLTVVAPASK